MATLVLGGVGAAAGWLLDPLNPAQGAQLGFAAGVTAAGLLFPPRKSDQSGSTMADVRIHGSGYGSTIPVVYGRFRLAGNVIDATDLIRHNRSGSGIKGAGASSKTFYSCSAAIAICRGPITSVDRIWAEQVLIYDSSLTPPTTWNTRIYLGDNAQTPDPYFEALHGVGNTPAYRGLAYIAFNDLDCSPWGNRLPSFNFEVTSVVPYSTLILDTAGLQVYYRFNTSLGTLVDSGPNGYTLSVVGSLTTTIVGHADQAPIIPAGSRLDAVIGNQPNLMPAAFSIEGWYQYKGGNVVNGENRFRYTNPTTGEEAWSLEVSPNAITQTVNLELSINTIAAGIVTVFFFSVARDAIAGIWHHFVVTYDTAGNAILYWDGVAQNTTPAPVAPITITSAAGNKISIENNDVYWDELAFYNRVLTPLEVYNHYQSKGTTTGTILADVFNQCGLQPAQYDVSQATDIVEGFLIHTRQDARTQIQELLRLYDTDLVERDGKLVALKRGGASLFTLPTADLGAHVTTGAETDPPVKVTVKRLPEMELPQRIELRYYDRTLNYQLGLQGASRYTKAGEVQDLLTINTTFVFHQDSARQKAEKELYRQWTEREQYNYSLGPAYLQIAPGDILTVPTGAAGTLRRTRVIALDLGLLGPLNVQAVLDDAFLLTQTAVGSPLTPSTEVPLATSVTLQAWSSNALVDGDATTVGMYVAAGEPLNTAWPGAAVYTSLDGGASYQHLDDLAGPADMGTANTALPNWAGGDVWDTVSTVDLLLTSGNPPASTSDGDVLAGSNSIRLGTEILQYATVTPQGGNVFRLSRLLRGRRGTEPHMGEHQVGEPWVLLTGQSVFHEVLGPSLAGKQVLAKCVSFGQTLAGVTAVPVWVGGDELFEYTPVHVTAIRNGGLDLIVSFVPRVRANGELIDGADVALTAVPESYTMVVMTNFANNITAISQDPVAALVTSPFHGFSNGNTVFFWGIVGAYPLNGRLATISNVTTSTFKINIATAGMPAFIATGSAMVQPIIRQITAVSAGPTVTYTSAQQSADFGSAQSSITVALWQNGALGPGYAAGPFTF